MINKRWITLPVVYSRPFISKAVFWAILKEFEFAVDSSAQKTAFEVKGRLYTTGVLLIVFLTKNTQKFSNKSLLPWFLDYLNFINNNIFLFQTVLKILQYNESQNKWFLEFIPLILFPEYGQSQRAV